MRTPTPSYSAWNACLELGTPGYLLAEEEFRAKLVSRKHILNYCYEVNGYATSIRCSESPRVAAKIGHGCGVSSGASSEFRF